MLVFHLMPYAKSDARLEPTHYFHRKRCPIRDLQLIGDPTGSARHVKYVSRCRIYVIVEY